MLRSSPCLGHRSREMLKTFPERLVREALEGRGSLLAQAFDPLGQIAVYGDRHTHQKEDIPPRSIPCLREHAACPASNKTGPRAGSAKPGLLGPPRTPRTARTARTTRTKEKSG